MEENLGKCGILSVRAAKTTAAVAPLQFLGRDIVEVRDYLYLGVYIQDDLSWSKQAGHLRKEAVKAANRSRGIFSNRRLPVQLRLKVYDTFILPILMYGAEAMILNTSQSSSLETVQLDVAKWILHCNTKTNSSAVRAMLGLTPLEIRRAARRLTLFGSISFCRAVPSSVLLSRLPAREDWVEQRKSGGQAKDWYQSTEPWIAQFAL